MNQQIQYVYGPYLGADPELFLRDEKGAIVPSDVLIPEDGLGGVVRDGVQAELHPGAFVCRASMGNQLKLIITGLADRARTKGLRLDFSQVIEIPKAQFDKLPMTSKLLGCMPSLNAYKVAPIRVNPNTYRKRSAAGHIHLGLSPLILENGKDVLLVKLLDAILGNTCVMIDRDPQAAVRRRNYGRAGEYRRPKHGLEYRTLSNFWLRDYKLFSFVTAVARLAVNLVGPQNKELANKLLESVDQKKVVKAINQNDLELAKENWQIVRQFILDHSNAYSSGIYPLIMPMFDHFLKKIEEEGLDYWFPIDKTVKRWTESWEGHSWGWETFINGTVFTDMNRAVSAKVQGMKS